MNIEEAKILEEYKFPVTEEKIFFSTNDNIKKASTHKSIVRCDTGELISVMKNSYKMISNERIIDSVAEQLEKLNTPFKVDNESSYLDNQQMRLHLTFPELFIQDYESKIFLSILVLNSLDGSLKFSFVPMLLRQICVNGMVARTSLGNVFQKKHTQKLNQIDLIERVEKSFQRLPNAKMRIEELFNTPITRDLKLKVEDRLGATAYKFISEQLKVKKENAYDLYNAATNFASHKANKKNQLSYHNEISSIFRI